MGLLSLLYKMSKKFTQKSKKKPTVLNKKIRSLTKSHQTCANTTTNNTSLHTGMDVISKLPSYKVEYVIDGDTVVVSSSSNKIKVRLDSIDCPENGQAWGDIATGALIGLIGGKQIKLETFGNDAFGRTLGTIYVFLDEKGMWQNVNERMVLLGHAWVMRMYYKHLPIHRQQKLNKLENWAKSKQVGLWKTDNPIPPWKWRKTLGIKCH